MFSCVGNGKVLYPRDPGLNESFDEESKQVILDEAASQ